MKILEPDALAETVHSLREQGKVVVHCHGCFDLMHPGHVRHLQAARRMGDVLVVTVTADEYVDKGPGRPIFTDALRAEFLAALECVDYVAVNHEPTAAGALRRLRPSVYVKGQEFEGAADKTGKLQEELAAVAEIGARVRYTHEIVFSSTRLLEAHFPLRESSP